MFSSRPDLVDTGGSDFGEFHTDDDLGSVSSTDSDVEKLRFVNPPFIPLSSSPAETKKEKEKENQSCRGSGRLLSRFQCQRDSER